MPESKDRLSLIDSHRRPMPGCLPLFCVLSAAFFAFVLYVVPVDMPEDAEPHGMGVVDYRHDAVSDFQIVQRSPLPLPFFGPAADARVTDSALPGPVRPALQAPQPLGDVSPRPASTVLVREEMLALPPQLQPAAAGEEGKEVQP